MRRAHVIEADLTWVNDSFEPNVQIVVGDNGLVEQIGLLDIQPTIRLTDRALLPGMINTHSHAFHRGLRGFGEDFSSAPGSPLRWAETLHELTECLDAEEFKNLCRMSFTEMLHDGITTVGEFHYLHHDRSGYGYAFDDLVLEAAQETGIRLVLLCCYHAGRSDQPLSAAERRFLTPDVDDFCTQVERLARRAGGHHQRVGLAVYDLHSAARENISRLVNYAAEHRWVIHLHADGCLDKDEEDHQPDASPLGMLLDADVLAPHVTLIHCHNASADQLRAVAATGAKVCLCPTTESNLGQQIIELPALFGAGAGVCLGTGSNVRISMNEEMRWMEYVQRASRRVRGVCVDQRGRTAHALWRCATTSGANALGIAAGRIASGCQADFIAVDTCGLSLLGATRESLLTAFVYGADRPSITHTCVGGNWHNWDD